MVHSHFAGAGIERGHWSAGCEACGRRSRRATRGSSHGAEKIDAVVEVGARLLCGATAVNVIDRLQEQVAANAERLSTERLAASSDAGSGMRRAVH